MPAKTPTQVRKQRQFEEREHLFLDQASALICQQGLLKLQMARVAAGCDYATGTLYQHFDSKEDLLLALATRVAGERVSLFGRVRGWAAPPRHQMVALVLADMLFARKHLEHYRLMQYVTTEAVWQAASASRREAFLHAGSPIGSLVHDIVSEAVAQGELEATHLRQQHNLFELAVGPWALSMGMHHLVHTQGLLQLYDIENPYRVELMHLQMLLNGMGWKPCINPYDHAAVDHLISHITDELFDDYCPNRVS